MTVNFENEFSKVYKMYCSPNSDYEDYGLLRCDTMQSGMTPQSSGWKGGSTFLQNASTFLTDYKASHH